MNSYDQNIYLFRGQIPTTFSSHMGCVTVFLHACPTFTESWSSRASQKFHDSHLGTGSSWHWGGPAPCRHSYQLFGSDIPFAVHGRCSNLVCEFVVQCTLGVHAYSSGPAEEPPHPSCEYDRRREPLSE